VFFAAQGNSRAEKNYGALAVGVPGENVGTKRGGAVNIINASQEGFHSDGNQLWHQDSEGIKGTVEKGDSFGRTLSTGDFNNDGFPDLAVGAPFEDVGTITDAGVVQIIYGSASGLNSSGNQIWHQDSDGINDSAEDNDNFGETLSTGDFNNDGFSDLAVGVGRENIGTIVDAGTVHIIYGSASGLRSEGNQVWHQYLDGMKGNPAPRNLFGIRLTTNDFNGDGFEDLAVAATREDVGSGAGVVHIIYGSADGLITAGNQIWHKGSTGMNGTASFGGSLASGDFNNDNFADLAIGSPTKMINTNEYAGAVLIIYGSTNGLNSAGNQVWNQGSDGMNDTAEYFDGFGDSLASGDFNGDNFADLAIGVPEEEYNGYVGAVHIMYGSSTGLSSADNLLWHQRTDPPSEEDPGFGFAHWNQSMTTGDFNRDGFTDLAVGMNGGKVDQIFAGKVHINYGSANGLNRFENEIWHQNSDGIKGSAEELDSFGIALIFIPPMSNPPVGNTITGAIFLLDRP